MAVLKVEAQAPAMAMPQRPLGAADVVDEDFQWLGVMIDGNVRRAVLTHADIRMLQAAAYRARQLITINPEVSLTDAIRLRKIAPRRPPPSPW